MTDNDDEDTQMSADSIDFFIHVGHQPPRLVEARDDDLLEAVLWREGVALDADVHMIVGADDEEEGVDAEPLAPGLTVGGAGLKRHGHLHCQRCRRIQVSVNYQSRTEQETFSPTAPIRRVRRWAQKIFGLTGPAAGDFVLQLCGSDVDAGLQQRLAEFVRDHTCSACFDFSKEVTPQG
ncbi:hypothetical protein B1806_03865 [Metallibacterium scheffleri]|uniref:Uncharacterized protein n=2 Tax=Metallibacterium scheffleri TaxID=993689 RepID=A0A4S3KQE3_9GAMM|nr:hypothetical protein B1806_03865 [Metallibacterium scheffleri]